MKNQVIQIKLVKSRKDMQNFIKLPWKINAKNPNWVPPLIMDQKKFLSTRNNPFLKNNPVEFFLAYEKGELVGRIAGIVNYQHQQYHHDETGFFGFLEGVNDKSIFEALLNTVKIWLKQHGYKMMLGPMNPSINYEMGFLIDGFKSPPFLRLPFNPPYYREIMESLGYEKARDFYSYFIHKNDLIINPKLQRVQEILLRKGSVSLRAGNMKRFTDEMEIIRDIYNDAWAGHWGFVPMTHEEFEFLAQDLRKIIDPELVLIAECNGDPVGFILALPNYNEVLQKIRNGRLFPLGLLKFMLGGRKIKGVRVITLGIKQKYQGLGIGSLFYSEIANCIIKLGYTHAELSWVLEGNKLMNRSAHFLGGKIYKTYRVYQMPLS